MSGRVVDKSYRLLRSGGITEAQFIKKTECLPRYLGRRYAKFGLDGDAIQEADLFYLESLRAFVDDRGIAFGAWAYIYVRRCLSNMLRNQKIYSKFLNDYKPNCEVHPSPEDSAMRAEASIFIAREILSLGVVGRKVVENALDGNNAVVLSRYKDQEILRRSLRSVRRQYERRFV